MNISLSMIIKDEEKLIRRCLESVKDFVDEIVIVDTGSQDKSLEIITEYTDKIYNYKWNGDFSSARNYCLSKCNFDWILVMDADEFLDNQSILKIREIVRQPLYEAYFLIQRNYTNDKLRFGMNIVDDPNIPYKGYFDTKHIRLFKNKYLFRGQVYELLNIDYKLVAYTNIVIHHYGFCDENHLNKKKEIYKTMWKNDILSGSKDLSIYINYLYSVIKSNIDFDYVFNLAVLEFGLNIKLFNVKIDHLIANKKYQLLIDWFESDRVKTRNWIDSDKKNIITVSFVFFINRDNKMAKKYINEFMKD